MLTNSPKITTFNILISHPSHALLSPKSFKPIRFSPLTKNRVKAETPMTELVKASAFRGNNSDEQIGFVQNDDGSSEFRPLIVSDGFHSTINSLSKWFVSSFFGAIILWRHDGEAMWAVIGAVINSMLSVRLKKIFNQDRPTFAVRADPGMPSSHAQSISFIVLFTVISILEWLGLNKSSLTISGVALAIASYLTWLRVLQKLHTVSQVLVGAAFGFTFSILWFWLWSAVVLNAFNSLFWVRLSVSAGAGAFCFLFLVYVFQNWLNDER